MFTGLVEGIGTVARLASRGGGREIILKVPPSFKDLKTGDSLCVSGACLTVTGAGPGEVVLEAIPETLKRTTLGRLAVGEKLNLERALTPDSRMGGHFVQGHVDGVGVIKAIRRMGGSQEVEIKAGPEILKYLVEKGSVALDGVSLTLVSVGEDSFQVALIPHTQKHTTLGAWQVGDEVNLEVDILAKYVERLLNPEKKRSITAEWLAEQGFK
jgi:riboflavin synthase